MQESILHFHMAVVLGKNIDFFPPKLYAEWEPSYLVLAISNLSIYFT